MSTFNNHPAEILILLFFIVTYFLSVVEKLADWTGTITYYTNHFDKTILQKMVPSLLLIVLIFEIITAILLVIGLYFFITEYSLTVAKISLTLSATTLLLFLMGQRLAKDYPGAMNITVYFILNIIGLYLLT